MSMDQPLQHPNSQKEDYQGFYTKDGVIPVWDHPLLTGHHILPTNYRPKVKLDQALSLVSNRQVKEDDMTVLKVLGDAICANEDQLRRYLEPIMTRSQVSKRLDTFRKHGLVQRWKVRIANDVEEEIRPPAPFTLGIAGYKLLKHYYNDQVFMEPDRWDVLGIPGIQRYVAFNEIRCRFVEARTLQNWQWNVPITNQGRIRSAAAVATVQTPQGPLRFIIERAQMSQNYIGYLKDTLFQWKEVVEQYATLPSRSFEGPLNFVVIVYASTVTMAEYIQSELLLDTFPFNIWLCVEEKIEDEGLDHAFYRPSSNSIQHMHLEFLNRQ
ncbi:replication-relaxation family protein [Gracilibacillus sp. YIM 98692]|uniref:replication-relaxation family protein n=1 Tax=Gracilibacillus sp. YIM 98692 TaxID=2663532 RepID=UPI001F08E923|nr:replication-relaxation family protein [Gracilibacillus sp. YIM 98692]